MTVQHLENYYLLRCALATQVNAYIDGAIIGIPVGKAGNRTIYQQFVRERNAFRDLGLS